MFFERGLGWRPHWSHTNLKRRVPSRRSGIYSTQFSALPSCSWIGWQGLLSGGHGEAARVNHRLPRIEETIPITEWYTSASPGDPPSRRRRIRSTWFEDRESFKDLTKPLPDGWTRHVAPKHATDDELCLYPDRCGEFLFKHSDMPNTDCEYWYYPFPVTNIQESTRGFTPDQTPFIFCETKKTQLWACQSGDKNILNLRNGSKAEIGDLHLHNEQQRQLFPEAIADDELGEPVQLVAIYRSRVYLKPFDKRKQRYTGPQEVVDRYTVLWVKEENGVAYRLASGSVGKDAWEELELEDISLVLG